MLKIERVYSWAPAGTKWTCRGPEFLQPPNREHVAFGPGSDYAIRDDASNYSWLLCEECRKSARKLGYIW